MCEICLRLASQFKNIARIAKLPYVAKKGFIVRKALFKEIVKFGGNYELWPKL